MGKKQLCHAITSSREEKELGDSLKKRGYKYYILYRLMIDTGISLQSALSLTVSDVKGRECLYVAASNSKTEKTLFPMSAGLIQEMELYLESKPLTAYVFCGSDNIIPLPEQTFRRIVIECAKHCGIKNITPMSLKKTYQYHKYLECGDINATRRELKLPSNKLVYDYFGIVSLAQNASNPKENYDFLKKTLFSPDYLLKIKNKINETELLIESCLQEKGLSHMSCQRLYNHLEKYVQDLQDLNDILQDIKQ